MWDIFLYDRMKRDALHTVVFFFKLTWTEHTKTCVGKVITYKARKIIKDESTQQQ
jgi:hypothetical protein